MFTEYAVRKMATKAAWGTKSGLALGFLIFMLSANALAQPILNEQGEAIPQTKTDQYRTDQIIVNFLPASITLPENRSEVIFEDAVMKQEVDQVLRAIGARKIRKVFQNFASTDTLRQLDDGKVVQVQDLSQVFLITFDRTINVQALVSQLSESNAVIYAQPNFIYKAEATPADPWFSLQWGLEQGSDEDIDAAAAWDIETGSYSVKLGIFDTGIYYYHPDFGIGIGTGQKVSGGYDWVNGDTNPIDGHFHGTHVAGIAGALTNNFDFTGSRVGMAGVAGGWNSGAGGGSKGAQLIAMKTLSDNGGGSTADAAAAIIAGADPNGSYGIQVANHSWGGDTYDETLRSAVNYAARMNRVFVAAKGNDNTSNPHYPSDYDGSWIISVGATSQDGSRAEYPDWGWGVNKGSNYGNGIDVTAPGTYIYSTTPTYQTSAMVTNNVAATAAYLSGTSMATPQVSGLAALILSQNSALHPEDVQGIIRSSADDKGAAGYDSFYGAGRINAARALQYMQSPWTLNQHTASGGTAVSNTGTYQVVFRNTGGGLATGTYIVKRYDVRKTVGISGFSGTPFVWGRGVNQTVGWSGASPNYQTGYCNVVSSTATSAELQTFVYEVWNTLGQYLGWYPSTPANVNYAYTVLGTPGTPKLALAPDTEQIGDPLLTTSLEQNTPNPFNPSTTIKFTLAESGPVTLTVFNLLGQEVRQLILKNWMTAGVHKVVWDGKDRQGRSVSSGFYIYRLRAGDFETAQRMLMLK